MTEHLQDKLQPQKQHRNQYQLVQTSKRAVRAYVMRFPESEPDDEFMAWVNAIANVGPTTIVLTKIVTWMEQQADRCEAQAKVVKRFATFRDALIADAKNYRAMAGFGRAAMKTEVT